MKKKTPWKGDLAEVLLAIGRDDADGFRKLLEAGLPPDTVVGFESNTPEARDLFKRAGLTPQEAASLNLLERASLRGARQVASLLIQAGAKVDAGKFKPLMVAHSLEMARLLLDSGADPNITRKDPFKAERGVTALMQAIASRRGPEMFELLLARGTDPHLLTSRGNSALSMAIDHGDAAAVKRLLQAGCKPDGTLLLRPILRGELDVVRAFIAAGADVNVVGKWEWKGKPVDSCTLLQAAVSERVGKIKTMRNLLSTERAKHAERFQSQADLYFTMTQELIRAGADVNRIHSSSPPLYWAANDGDLEMVKLLLQAKADPNLRWGILGTPLHAACRGGFVEIAECLLKAGADVKITGVETMVTDADGKTNDAERRTALEELRTLALPHELEIWEKSIKQGTKPDPGVMEAKYEVWHKNRATLIKLLESSPGSEHAS